MDFSLDPILLPLLPPPLGQIPGALHNNLLACARPSWSLPPWGLTCGAGEWHRYSAADGEVRCDASHFPYPGRLPRSRVFVSLCLIVSCCSFLLLKYSSLFIVVINAVFALVPSLCDLSPYYGGGG